MKESCGFKVILIVLALTLVIFGGWRLLDPIGFYAFSGLELSDDAGLFSEVRGAGGIIRASGLVVGLGAFRHAWTRTPVVLAAMVFMSLGLARLLGIALDGSPGAEVIQGMAIELVLGGLALLLFSGMGRRRVARDNQSFEPNGSSPWSSRGCVAGGSARSFYGRGRRNMISRHIRSPAG